MARLYLATRGGPAAHRWTWLLFWLGMAGAVLLKGPIGPMVAGLTGLALVVWDRRAGWLASLRWDWGLIVFAGIVLPWALAITVETDGGFWGMAVGGDLAPKLFGGQEGHGAPPGYFLLLSPVLLFPAVLLAPAAAVAGWRGRAEPAIRFALCWLVPSWLVFELVPTKLPHYTLPCFGAIAWLMAAALTRPLGERSRWLGAALNLGVGAGLAIAGALAAGFFGGVASDVWAAIAAVLVPRGGGHRRVLPDPAAPGGGRSGGRRARRAGAQRAGGRAGADAWASSGSPSASPRTWRGPAPTASRWVRWRSPATRSRAWSSRSAPPTELGDAGDAADAINEGRPAVVAGRADAAFRTAIAQGEVSAKVAAAVSGLDYSTGHAQVLRLYEPMPPAPIAAAPNGQPQGSQGAPE